MTGPRALLLLPLLLAANASATEPATPVLVEQKLRLLELLVASATAKSADAAAVLEKRRQLLDQARGALSAGETAEAGRLLDEALARIGRPAAAAGGPALTAVAQEARRKNLAEQLASYRATLAALAREGRSAAEAQTLLARTDSLTREADGHLATGRLDLANQRLSEAYRLMVEGLARLQSGQTLILSLKFDTPEQEYAYEQRRFQSHEMLLKMNLDENTAGDRRQRVDALAGEGRRRRDEAEALAASGDHRAAVAALEQASSQLVRALQALGVPVF